MRPTLLTLILISTLAAPAAWGAVEKKKPMVVAETALTAELAQTLTYPARVDARIQAAVLSDIDGRVESVTVELGSAVKRNQVLAEVRHTDPGFEYAPVRLRSPVSGTVSLLPAVAGTQVRRGDLLAKVIDPKSLRLWLEVTAADLPSIVPGLHGVAQVPGSTAEIPVQVAGVSPQADAATGTATAELVPLQSQGLVAGQLLRVRFKTGIRQALSIPEDALQYAGDQPYVHTIDTAKKVHNTNVKIGLRQDGHVEIVEGLKAGDKYVERSSGFVADGQDVDVQETPTATQTTKGGK
jgi:multidrug efflux pump subunit AcrA (membrane-fusion protein)